MGDPILESIEVKLETLRQESASAREDVTAAADALTMAQQEERRVQAEIERMEQAKAALEGKSDKKSDADDVLTEAIKQVQAVAETSAQLKRVGWKSPETLVKPVTVQFPNADGKNPWSQPSDKPRIAKLGEDDVLLEPGWTIGKNSFNEDALIPPGAVVVQMAEPAVPTKRSATSLGASEFETDLPEMGGHTPVRGLSRGGIEELE